MFSGAPVSGMALVLAESTPDGVVIWVGVWAGLLVDFFAIFAVTAFLVSSSWEVMAWGEGLLSIVLSLAVIDCIGNSERSVLVLEEEGGGVFGVHVAWCFSSASSMLKIVEILPSFILQRLGAIPLIFEHLNGQ